MPRTIFWPLTKLRSLDPALGLKYANRACKLWKSPLALLQRGRIKADYTMLCGDLTYADEADRDVKAASLLLDDNSYVRIQKLATPLLLASAFRDSPDETIWKRYLTEAGKAAKAIEQQSSRRLWEFFYLAQYYRAMEDEQKEMALYRQVPSDCWTDHFTFHYLARVDALGEKPDAALVERIKRGESGPMGALGLAFLLALEGKVEESKHLSSAFGERSPWIEAALASCDVYDLCGEPDKAKELAEEKLEQFQKEEFDPLSRWERDFLLRFRAGQIDEEQLLTAAERSNTKRRWLTYAHWRAAMKHLGEGELPEANKHLCECERQHSMYDIYNPWSQALIRRLEGVDIWPPCRAAVPAGSSDVRAQ